MFHGMAERASAAREGTSGSPRDGIGESRTCSELKYDRGVAFDDKAGIHDRRQERKRPFRTIPLGSIFLPFGTILLPFCP
jgi:hypothetical protein